MREHISFACPLQFAEREPVRARAAVEQALEADAITIRRAEAGRNDIAEYGLVPVQLATDTMPESVVAGACYLEWKKGGLRSSCAKSSSASASARSTAPRHRARQL
jgi:hypothetical protein